MANRLMINCSSFINAQGSLCPIYSRSYVYTPLHLQHKAKCKLPSAFQMGRRKNRNVNNIFLCIIARLRSSWFSLSSAT